MKQEGFLGLRTGNQLEYLLLRQKQLALISLRFQALSRQPCLEKVKSHSPESSSDSLRSTVGDGRRREDSSLDLHHGSVDFDIPSLDLGESFVLELRSPIHNYGSA
jgi:hypothetical protein